MTDPGAIIFETDRCYVTPFKKNDFSRLLSLHGSDVVMKHIGIGKRSEEQVQCELDNIIDHQNRYGYSAWAVYEKKTHRFVGRAGLIHMGALVALDASPGDNPGEDAGVEVGYILRPPFWNKGLATELSKACIQWGFEKTSLSEILAKTSVENLPSQKVIRNNGMSLIKKVEIEGRKGLLFSITRDHYNKT